jgi:hypothetical protein
VDALKAWVRQHATAVGSGLVLTALVALVVIGAIVAGRIGEEVATASGPASPSVAMSASSSPDASQPGSSAASAAPSVGPVWHGYEVRDVAGPLTIRSWLRVSVDRLNIREAAASSAAVAGVAELGDLLQVTGDPAFEEEREWAPVVGDGVAGWVATGDEIGPFVRPVATPWLYGPHRELLGLAAGAEGLVAYGWASDLDALPYEGIGSRAMVFTSADGSAWHEADLSGGPVVAAAGGDGAFGLAQVPSYIEPNVVRVSGDGAEWSEPAVLSFQPSSAASGPGGVVLVGNQHDGNRFSARIRSDGSIEEASLSGEVPAQPLVEASDVGYVAFERGNSARLLVSTDGLAWTPVSIPGVAEGEAFISDVELDGARLVVVLWDGITRLRFGQLDASGGVTWEPDELAPFATATVAGIAAGNGDFLAIGWDSGELVPRVWRSSDAHVWTDLGVDAGTFGGAIGPEPVFAMGRWYAATDAIYASDDGAAWEEVFRPPMPATERPGCPPAPEAGALDLMFLNGLAADCFGDTSLAFTAWVPLVEGLGGCCSPVGEPEWLNPSIPTTYLSPGPSEFAGSFAVYPVPGIETSFEPESWVTVTGHFHDTAAQECRLTPIVEVGHWLASQSSVIEDCERRFVIDSVVPATAPVP